MIMPFKTLERKSSAQPLNSQTSIVYSGKKTENHQYAGGAPTTPIPF